MQAWGSLTRVRHLNCGTFTARLGGPPLVTHVVVLEFEHGLVLVDSGLGIDDVEKPTARLGRGFRALLPALDPAEAAVSQLEGLGHRAGDVTDILLTHLDLDHLGGASDFPTANVHATGMELALADARADIAARVRYRPLQLAAVDNRTVGHDDFSDELFGFEAHRLHESVAVIPLPGHTAGHAAIAIRDPQRGWLLHAGDAFHHRRALTGQRSGRSISAVETVLAADRHELRANQRRLAELARSQSGVQIFCAHDPVQFAALSGASA